MTMVFGFLRSSQPLISKWSFEIGIPTGFFGGKGYKRALGGVIILAVVFRGMDVQEKR